MAVPPPRDAPAVLAAYTRVPSGPGSLRLTNDRAAPHRRPSASHTQASHDVGKAPTNGGIRIVQVRSRFRNTECDYPVPAPSDLWPGLRPRTPAAAAMIRQGPGRRAHPRNAISKRAGQRRPARLLRILARGEHGGATTGRWPARRSPAATSEEAEESETACSGMP